MTHSEIKNAVYMSMFAYTTHRKNKLSLDNWLYNNEVRRTNKIAKEIMIAYNKMESERR
jgi:hypothetical protein